MILQNEQIDKRKKVFVAMSGGVDSSVAAGLLKERGFDVVGVTMCFSIPSSHSKKPSCCGVDGIEDAKRAAQILDIPHYVLDFAKDINDYIINDFISEYLDGRTPNPCVRCNQYLKFGTLYERVKNLGADYLATGHYAKIHYNNKTQDYELKRGEDSTKDQSYFLYSIKKEILPWVLFPLGEMSKGHVRQLARKYGLNTAEKPESQDICFVSRSGYKKFIKDRVGEENFIPGSFVDENGEVIGEHKGIAHYTIGQREGLGLALGYPVYVFKIDKEKRTVYVGPQSCLYSKGFYADRLNWFKRDIPHRTLAVQLRIRYNSAEVKGYLTYLGGGRIKVEFEEPQKSVSPGQSVVFYDNDVVLGGAVIHQPSGGDLEGISYELTETIGKKGKGVT